VPAGASPVGRARGGEFVSERSGGVRAPVGALPRVPDRLRHEIGRLHLGHVPGGWQHFEARPVDGSGIGLTVGGLDNLIALTPQHKSRDSDAAEAAEQRRVGHRRGAGIDRQGCSVSGHDCLLGVGDTGGIDTEEHRVMERECLDLGHG
jgi:hypothetical protein